MIAAYLKAYWKPLAAFLLVAGSLWLAHHLGYSSGYGASDTVWSDKWAKRDKADADSRIAFTQDQRRIELTRQANIDQIQREADEETRKANAARANAQRTADQLQSGIRNAIAKLQRGGSDTGATSSGKTGASASDLLADLYRSIDQAAGDYAEEADRRGRVAMNCEKAYDAIRNSPSIPPKK